MMDFRTCLHKLPMIAVLRGIEPTEALDIGGVLIDAGFTILEVTMNSPEPYKSIETLAAEFGDRALIGAGTVTSLEQVAAIYDAGGRLVISPHMDVAIIQETIARGLVSLPGVLSPTEAFAALAAGADGLKFFPAEAISPSAIKAVRAVLPKAARIFVIGGVSAANMHAYLSAGADGFGVGSSLFKPGRALDTIRSNAIRLVDAFKKARTEQSR